MDCNKIDKLPSVTFYYRFLLSVGTITGTIQLVFSSRCALAREKRKYESFN